MVPALVLAALGVGFAVGFFSRPPKVVAETVETKVIVKEADVAALNAAEAGAVLDLAREHARAGRLQMARLTYEHVLKLPDKGAASTATEELKALKEQARAYEQFLNERSYEPFADGLNGSSARVNTCKFAGVMYGCTKDEARAMFARYLKEHTISGSLQVNIRYPFFHWGANHGNLQWGFAHAVADVLAEQAEGGEEKLAAYLQGNGNRRHTFHRSFELLRRIGNGRWISAESKGRLYWQLSEAFSQLSGKKADETPASVRHLLGDLKNTIKCFAAHKNFAQATNNGRGEGDVF
jgi:hypothetical protein